MSALSIANPAPSERHLTGGMLFLLAGLAALGALATNIILPAFPQIGAELAVSAPELGLLLSSFFVAFALGQLVAGPLSDRFGRKPLVLGGLAVFAAGSIVCALAGHIAGAGSGSCHPGAGGLCGLGSVAGHRARPL